MINFLDLVLSSITATTDRKLELKASFAKQVSWTEKVQDPDNPEKEIDNPVTFKECFNKSVTEYIRQICIAGQQKLDKELQKEDDQFNDLKGE